jgi:hypothetical protein
MDKQVISYDRNGFIIHGKREFLISGEFHYFRVPAASWEDRLQKMKRAGANCISVYIPWSFHEPEEGKERWTGDYDVGRFINLCEKYGFYILVKPGPYICADYDFGGHPDWLIAKIANQEFRIRMLDEGYLKMCKRWYQRVSQIINPHLITNGGKIIAIQIENEYDHLIEYGEETITRQDAIDYFEFLRKTMEELKIDIPKFANESAFLRGRGIIDTRTYYPNIPGLWYWEFDLFDGKIVDSKKEQPDCPIMVLELQAGWFAQIGAPLYEPGLDVLSGVSKSVLIQGATLLNYFMMVGGTSFPFMGARGDIVFLGGLGNITSYDFGGALVREWGEIHPEKYYWAKGFNRFAGEFVNIILESDHQSYCRITSGGENIALLGKGGAELDSALNKSEENFDTSEEGNENGRFFFIRNLEKDPKDLTINVSKDLTNTEHSFQTTVLARETRMLPVAFKIPGANLRLNYSSSEVLLSKKYEQGTAFIIYGKKGTAGETCLNVAPDNVAIIQGDVKISQNRNNSVLKYHHSDIIILKINDVKLFIIEEEMIGRVEELSKGLMFHNLYYIAGINETADTIELSTQVKENSAAKVRFFPMTANTNFSSADFEGKPIDFSFDKQSNFYTAGVNVGSFPDKPQVEWTSAWKYHCDQAEVDENFDHSSWRKLNKPVSLEVAGFIEHGYYWYRTQFELEDKPELAFMDYRHNDTDRMFIYLNNQLIYKSHNKKIKQWQITKALKPGKNTMAILYANEFHNKSHPHEGDIVKYSGIMNPFEIYGKYAGGRDIKISLTSFYVQKGLSGMNKGFHTLACDDKSWNSAPEVPKFVTAPELGHIVWFRRKFKYQIGAPFEAPIQFVTLEADQRLTIYVNGRAVARYDILGPQQEFYVPEPFLNQGENVLAIILECPAFYEELQGSYRRGYMYNPELRQRYVAKKATLSIR